MIYKKLSEGEAALLEILEHPLWCSEFLRQEADPMWELTFYQKEVLLDCGNYISFRAGRSVGKTESLIDLLIYYSINDFFPTHVVALTTPNRVHLTPIWRKLTRWLGFHPFLRHFRKSINSQTFTLGLSNGLTIDCRIAGVTGTGASVIGLHSPIILLDEGGFYNWPVWIELGPTLNVWEKGFKLYVCGTPSGQRENNVLYYADIESEQYTKHRVSAFDNPRYTKEDDERNQQQYGGKEGDDYQRLVLGEHSSPVTVLFAKDTLPLEPFNTFTATLTNRALEDDPGKALRLLESLPKEKGMIAAGIDLGFNDPTVISLFSNTTGPWKHFARITLLHIDYPKQVRFIDKLDDLYDFSFLAIDEGSSGLFVGQEILSDKYKHKFYSDKLITVAFSANVEIGLDLDGNPLKVSTRNLTVEKLRSLFNNKSLLLSSRDSRLISELQRVEGTRTPSGNTVYRVRTPGGSLRGEDHRLASFLCFSYALYMKEDYKESKPKPTKLWSGARWGRE